MSALLSSLLLLMGRLSKVLCEGSIVLPLQLCWSI